MNKVVRYIIGGAIGLVVLIIICIIWFSAAGLWPVVLDVVLVLTALTSAVMLAALTVAVFLLTRTVLQVKDELSPVLTSLRSTSTAVRETAKTAGTFGLNPAVRAASLVAGAGEMAAVVLGRGHAHKRAEKRQKRRQEIERELAAKGELDGYR